MLCPEISHTNTGTLAAETQARAGNRRSRIGLPTRWGHDAETSVHLGRGPQIGLALVPITERLGHPRSEQEMAEY